MTFEQIFSVNNVMFTAFDYPMSWLEFFGTILNLASVFLVARRNILTWPVGIAAVILFAILFYQIRIYADFIEQIYYFFTCIYGWWIWKSGGEHTSGMQANWSSGRAMISWVVGVAAVSVLFSMIISRLHLWLPGLFPEAASYPELDSFTTVASFAAMLLMAHKRIECWIYWIVVDVIGVWLYFVKGVVFVSGLYGVFLVLASLGLLNWLKQPSAESVNQTAA